MQFLLRAALVPVLCCLSVRAAAVSPQLLKTTVYYESLCPYSIKFIVEQLYPAYQKIGPSLLVDLVPYGNAKQSKSDNGSWAFECQHGPEECFGNKVQACGLAEHKDQNLVVGFVKCLEEQEYPGREEAVVACAPELEVASSTILDCAKGAKGDVLLAYYGDRTKSIKYLIPGVPSVFFNDMYNEKMDEEAVEDLLGTACRLLMNKPEGCPQEINVIQTNDI